MIERGRKANAALKVVIYGPEGIGKSTFAAQFPRAVFEDTEGSTAHMDVARTPKSRSWTELLQHVQYFIAHPEELGTYILDTADWADKLCTEQLIAENASKGVKGVEDFGYGKGYVYIAERFGQLLNLLEQLKERGVHIVLTAHAMMRKFEQPDEMGAYDRWEMKLSKKVAPLVKEWADMILFANYKTFVRNVDGQGAAKGKNKASGGQRVMYTTHHPCWDAKNRFGLPDELPFDYSQIAHLIVDRQPCADLQRSGHSTSSVAAATASPQGEAGVMAAPRQDASPQALPLGAVAEPQHEDSIPALPLSMQPNEHADPDTMQALWQLMLRCQAKPIEVQAIVAGQGYLPADVPINEYESTDNFKGFIRGWIIPNWDWIESEIRKAREQKTPF